jgi:hypothetical protein
MDITKGGWNFFKRRPPLIIYKLYLYATGLLTGWWLGMLVSSATHGDNLVVPVGQLLVGVLLTIPAFLILNHVERLERS